MYPLRSRLVVSFVALVVATAAHSAPQPAPAKPTAPPAAALATRPLGAPVARTVDVTETLFGVHVTDPYRWMEGDPNPEVAEWLRAQGSFSDACLAQLPGRDSLLARVRQLGLGYGFASGVQVVGERIFHLMLAAGEQLPKLMLRDKDGAERVLVDPTTRGGEGTHASINNFAPSPNGELVAYALSKGGSEVSSIRVLNVATGQDLPDVVERIWGEFAASWLPDGKGFFYTQMAAPTAGIDPNLNMHVRLHRLGRPVSGDPTMLAGSLAATMKFAPEEFPHIIVPPGSRWALAIGGGARNEKRLAAAELTALDTTGGAATSWSAIADYDDGVEAAVLHGDRLYLLSHKDASGRRVVSVPIAQPELAKARVEIAEDPESPLIAIADASDGLYAERMSGGHALVLRLPWGAAQATTIALPFEAWVNKLATDPRRDGFVFDLEGWTRPRSFYSYDPRTRQVAPLLIPTFNVAHSPLVEEEVEAVSVDGTRVPLSILRRRDLTLDGSHPAILYGYGAYGTSQNPRFNPTIIAWLERSGVYAVAHVRGGSEKGYAWQIGGTGAHKMNGVHDFIACGEYLISRRYTSASRLAASGGSMGGVLVGRALTERPDLFAAVHIGVGITNPLRILAAENGANQKAELGDPETEAGFRAILEMDPYQHIRPGTAYSAVLFTIGLNDRRVAPWMTAKTAARLKAATTSGKPVLIRLDRDAGHGIGSTRDQQFAERADVWTFLLAALGDPDFQPAGQRSAR